MPYLLNLFYLLLLAVASPYLIYCAVRSGKYLAGWREKFWGDVPLRDSHARCLWLHAVSVGEVNLLEPILKRWDQLHPDWDVVISTTTLTGYALAKKRYAPRTVFYCPLDFSWAVRRALRRIRPDLLVLAELELWPNLIRLASLAGVKIAVVNGRLSEKSFRGYQRIASLVRAVLGRLDAVGVQNEEYRERFVALGADPARVRITGSIKFDGAVTDRGNPRTVAFGKLAGIEAGDVVFLAGSTQAPEEALALETFRRLAPRFPYLRLLITPRHPERFDETAAMLDRSGVPWIRRSLLDHSPKTPIPRVVLIDAVGELGAWWGLAEIAFVGGSLGQRGGQNMIEPAAYGAAICFGPNTWNFRDVVQLLLASEAAIVVRDGGELTQFVERCLSQRDYSRQLGQRARQFVLSQTGAAQRTLDMLDSLASSRPLRAVA